VFVTERPDVVGQFMLSGRVAVLMDNSPRALVVPALFWDFFTSADDFYEWRPFVSFLRLLRFTAFNIAVPLPAIYVAVTTYHLQALPTQLTLSLLAQREGAPLPPPVEAAVMTLMFELLREAGIRLPRAIGPTVSIVGGLVIGDAAIRSGLTSPAMVLVVSATAVATFSLPSPTMANAATYYRFFVSALTTGFGFFGLLLGYLIALANVASLTSIGIPYMSPVLPLQFKYLKPLLGMRRRPPKGMGTQAPPGLIQDANDFEERGK
jgi:spore germination protein KA